MRSLFAGVLLLSSFMLSACSVTNIQEDEYILLAKHNTQGNVVIITEDFGGNIYPRIHYIENVIEKKNQSVRILAASLWARLVIMMAGTAHVTARTMILPVASARVPHRATFPSLLRLS